VNYGNRLHRKRDEKYFLNPKLIIRQIGKTPIATYDEDRFYTLNTIYNVINISNYSLKYFIGIINSKIGKWFWIKNNCDFKSLFPKIKKTQLKNIPIRTINFDNPQDKSGHDKIVELVERMLSLNKQLSQAKSSKDKDILKRQIDLTDSEIDRLVYKLYDLTPEEIELVEGNA
jgi:adenine-specific DNA-methyltransferase